MVYEPRTYRHLLKNYDLVSFSVVIRESDLYIRARRNLRRKALKALLKCRSTLEGYMERHPHFLTAMEPLSVEETAPQLVAEMSRAAEKAGVGPMAAVAGAIAESVGQALLPFSPEIIVENGGDIFLSILRRRLIGVYAGESSFSGRLALEINPEDTPLGVCTSSGTVGHSFSKGKAGAAVVLSTSTALADATATAVGNLVQEAADIPRATEFASHIEGIKGVVIIIGDALGVWGEVKLVRLGADALSDDKHNR